MIRRARGWSRTQTNSTTSSTQPESRRVPDQNSDGHVLTSLVLTPLVLTSIHESQFSPLPSSQHSSLPLSQFSPLPSTSVSSTSTSATHGSDIRRDPTPAIPSIDITDIDTNTSDPNGTTATTSHFSSGLKLTSTAPTSPSAVDHSVCLGSEFDLSSDFNLLESDLDSILVHQISFDSRDADEDSNYLISSYELQEAVEVHEP